VAPLAFDDTAADDLVAAAEDAATTLRTQGPTRRTSAENAMDGFRGGFAKLFEVISGSESQDRGRLGTALDSLAEKVGEAKTAATKEKARLAALEAWESREEARSSSGGHDPYGLLGDGLNVNNPFFDPKPSALPIAPPTVSAAFAPTERTRVTGRSTADDTTSADPEALRGFVSSASTMNGVLDSKRASLESAWASFTHTCSWVPLESTTFLGGFTQLVALNRADETWITSIAQAFEEAGKGSLSNFDLTLKVCAEQPEALQTLLFDGSLTASEASIVWAAMAKSKNFNAETFIDAHPFELCNLNGLPFWAMDRAGRAVLDYALGSTDGAQCVPGNLENAYARLGFKPGERSMEDFAADLQAIRDALGDASDTVTAGTDIQLVSLGRHDGAMTAGVSIGNLDTASTVGVFVSGMNSNVRELGTSLDAFQVIRKDNPGAALVNWIGYHSPNIPEESFQDRADAGAPVLAAFLDGIQAQRVDHPMDRFVTMGHSYGTNVLAEALKQTRATPDAYVALGSAGLTWNTKAEDLGVKEIYATDAEGDNIADGIGQYVQFRDGGDGGGLYQKRLDPRDLEGADEFTSEGTADGKPVTMHNLTSPMQWWGPLQWIADADGTKASDEVGYLNPESSTVHGLTRILQGKQDDLE
jgi:hypothetical protein